MRCCHIFYVAYGADCFVQEAAYSILSLWRQPGCSHYKVTVVTDRSGPLMQWLGIAHKNPSAASPSQSAAPGLTVLPVQPDQIAAWRGDQGYEYRVKPLAIRWAAGQVAAAEDLLLFVDSDTVFTRAPARLFEAIAQDVIVLNACEGRLAASRRRTRSHGKLYRASCRQAFAIRGHRRRLALDTQLWNSGVIGLPCAMLDVFDETVAVIDELYRAVRIQTVEQVALSVVLQDRGARLQDSGDVVFHYHYFKEFRQDLARFFDRYAAASLEQRLARWPEIDPVLRAQPKQVFNALPKWQRQFLKWVGRAWRPLPYPWE